jgi:hypothetical protein
MRARTDLNRAQMLVARRADGDLEAASTLAQRAHTTATSQGYAAIQRDAELVFDELP